MILMTATLLTACGGMRGQEGISSAASTQVPNSVAGGNLNLASVITGTPVAVARYRNAENNQHGTAGGKYDIMQAMGLPTATSYRESYLLVASLTPATGLHPMFLCYAGGFFSSTDANCEGQHHAESITLYLSDGPTADMPIPLYRCYNPSTGDHMDTTNPNGECNGGTGYHAEYVLGFGG